MPRSSSETTSPRAGDARAALTLDAESLAAPLLTPSTGLPAHTPATPPDASLGDAGKAGPELFRIAGLAGPLVLQNVAGYTLSMVSAAFVGHYGHDPSALPSAVLAGSFYNVTGFSLVIGLSSGMETLCGQAYGAGNYAMLGLVLQRALLICWAACVPIALFWRAAPRVLAALHQEPAIVDGASRYLAIATPALFLSVISSCLYRYLVTQQEVRPSTICTVITALLCPLFNWWLIFRLDLGLEGAAWAFVASTGAYSLLLLAYTVARDVLRRRRRSARLTWAGFSWRAWQGWGQFLRYALPSASMICMEWWVYEVVIFMAGSLGDFAEVAVASMGISFYVAGWAYMLPMAVGTAANTRVANWLGAGSAVGARTAARVAIACAVALQSCIAVLLFCARGPLASAFTTQPGVVDNVGRIMPIVAANVVADGSVAVLGGVLRGSGRQSMGAVLNLVGYWGLGCPLAVLLCFRAGLDVLGLWIGLATATAAQAMILVTVVLRFDWQKEVQRAAVLAAEHAEERAAEEQQQQQHQRSGDRGDRASGNAGGGGGGCGVGQDGARAPGAAACVVNGGGHGTGRGKGGADGGRDVEAGSEVPELQQPLLAAAGTEEAR